MKGFFGRTHDEVKERLDKHRAPAVVDFLRWFYPDQQPCDYDVEAVLSYLFVAEQVVDGWTRTPPAQLHRGARYRDVVNLVGRILDKVPAGAVCPRHRQLLDTVQQQDSIITLNYDLILDRVLVNAAQDPRHSQRMGRLRSFVDPWLRQTAERAVRSIKATGEEQGVFLKLHGSLDWSRCSNVQCHERASPELPSSNADEATDPSERSCATCGHHMERCIIPPASFKLSAHDRPFGLLWKVALETLRDATEVVVIGISFAAGDFQLRWLIRQSVALSKEPPRVVVVNPEKQHALSAMPLFGIPPSWDNRNRTWFQNLDCYLKAAAHHRSQEE